MIDSIIIRTVSILGPGLLGGSLALALKKYSPGIKVHLCGRREEPLETARKLDAADLYTVDLNEAVQGSDLVVLATPVGTMRSMMEQVAAGNLEQALVTDVGSVKGCVHRDVGSWLSERNVAFIGSHPMAGSEKQGMEYADPELFCNAMVALTNEENLSSSLVSSLRLFWETVGGRVIEMDSVSHDRAVARISHMPHALASVCARGSGKDCTDMLDSLKALAAGGFRDTTRVSMGKPSMWAEILMENGEEVLAALDTCAAELDCLRNLLRQGNRDALKLWLQGAGDMRRTIMHPSPDESGLE
ncbi:prephenate dehydrogenase/arogenate dehydrogenase family protein [Akkermansia sp. N21169]|uniref:prephenate dehydrogenase n=1 Tax=Akkermansia sp. N21169 TaxID=3040765 RepID=UPI00244E63F9|nr:prephenate dehydrogenase/arogenate dehydrogenase family protein [Akkermansia sp. N21169]MDH3067741.1 prephenate dehydrogenase/arogenate dehydrogenase family protein [Akkermansia sp. N21169]